MKKLITFFTIIISLIPLVLFSQGFNSITTPDGVNVIAVGNNGLLFRSANSGNNWTSYVNGSLNQKCIVSFVNDVWISAQSGIVYKTLKTFAPIYSYNTGSVNDLNSIYFINSNTGFVCGNSGTVYKSTNGGVNWFSSNSGISSINLNSIIFKDLNAGIAVGDSGKIYKTINGGASWTSEVSGTMRNLLKVKYFNNDLVTVGEYGTLLINTGIGWSSVSTRTNSDIRGISGTSINDVHVCGGGGFIRNNKNGSSEFLNFEINPIMASLIDIHFINSSIGFAVSSTNNAIIKTTNSGQNWELPPGATISYSYTRKQATTGNIGNPFCLHPQNRDGVFILAGSSLYRSLDKGNTWVLLNGSVPGSSCHSFYVNSIDTNIMIASKGSSNGRVIKSTDYGTTWFDIINPINLTSYGMPLEQDPNNPYNIFLAPDNAPMRISTNFGDSWINLGGGESGGIFRSPCDVSVKYGNSNEIIVGDGTTGSGSGKVWKSLDGGINWQLINTVTGSEIPMISNNAINQELFYHTTWSSGSFWKSTNSGSNFSNLNVTGSLWATDIAKDDPTAVCYDYYGSNSYLSLNSGANFTLINVGSSPAAGICFMDKSNLLIQHGGGVYKLNINYNILTDPLVFPIDVQVTSLGDLGTKIFPANFTYPFGKVKNNSLTSAVSLNVTRKINPGGYVSTKTVSNLAADSIADVIFDSWSFTSGVTYTVKDSVYSANDILPDNDTLSGSLTPYTGTSVLKFEEGFSSGTFPPPNWTITYTGISYWYRSTVSGYGSGTGSSKYDIWNSPLGTTQSLNSLTLAPSVFGDSLKFDLAYAPFPGSTDSLIVMVSNDSGNSYTDLVRLYGNTNGGAPLNTTGSAISEFTPASNQWGKRSYLLPAGTTNIRFKGVNGYGNNIYVDNVQIAGVTPFTLVNLRLVPEGLHNRFTLNRKDTISAYLRETSPPFKIIDSAKKELDTVSFTAILLFQNLKSGNYYIQVKHKNSIETWSKSGGEYIAEGNLFNYDFTTSQSQAYGNNMILKNSLYCLYSGDVNQDGEINLSDILSIYNDAANFKTGNVVTDLNGDYIVNLSDQIIGFNNLVNFVRVVRP